MKRFLTIALAAAITFACAMPVRATEAETTVLQPNMEVVQELGNETTYTSGDFTYVLNEDGTAKIRKYVGSRQVVIPAEIDGITVTVIGVNSICPPNTYGATSITIPATVTKLEEGFAGTYYMKEIIIEDGNTAYKVVDGALLSMDGKNLLAFENNSNITEYTVPDGVEHIARYAFARNDYLEKVTISDSVTSMSEEVFIYADIEMCVLGNGIVEIPVNTFFDCNKLSNVVFSDSVKEIHTLAFYSCDNMKSIELGKNLETISTSAFANSGLESVTIPASVTEIKKTAFYNCANLREFKVEEGSKTYKILNEAIVSLDETHLVVFPQGSETTEYVIPRSVTTIDNYAFACCKNLKVITIMGNVKSLGDSVFEKCTGFETVIIPGEVESLNVKLFSNCTNLKSVFLPSSIKEIQWGAFEKCTSLEKVYFVGSDEEWSNVSISDTFNYNDVIYTVEMIYLDNLRDFVARMYTKALGRDYDGAGLNGWILQLIEQTHDGAGLAKEFILGQEFALRNLSDEQFVNVLYATFFNREADAEGKQLWLATLASGATREYVLSQFVNLDEFTLLCAYYGINRGVMFYDGSVAAPGLPQFVARLYGQVLGRASEREGFYNWTSALHAKTVTAEEAAVSFFMSEEYALKNVDCSTFVTDCYKVFMDREPDADGLSFWVSCLEDQGVDRQWVISEFAKSAEFKEISAKYGL